MQSNLQKPYLKIEILEFHDPNLHREELLKQIGERFIRTHHINPIYFETTTGKSIVLNYENEAQFEKLYNRDVELFEAFMKRFVAGDITIDLDFKNDIDKPEDTTELYLILKYSANFKNAMRKNYSFTARVAQILGVQVNIEEIEDGFLFFFKRKADYEDFIIDTLNPDQLIAHLRKKTYWKPEFMKLMEEMFSSLKKK